MSELAKGMAALEAINYVRNGMKIGIGSGSTAEAFIEVLGKAVDEGLDIVGVPTSERTASLCRELSVPLTTLDETPNLDLTIDGADEVDPALNLIKGGGGALLREKIVASASDEMLVIADDSKMVNALGAFPLPIEVNLFGLRATRYQIEKVALRQGLSGEFSLRKRQDGEHFSTDGGHLILDASFSLIPDPVALDCALNKIPGVVENGLFTGLASRVIVASETGTSILEAGS